jgi:hypothetical protein
MAIQSPETIAVPDTPLALFDHSRRVFLFGALHGRRRGLQPDPELLYAEAMFHDLGLTARYRTSTLRFEVDGANAAREFLLQHGVDKADADRVWLSIALHNTPGIPEFLAPEIALVTAASRPTCSASAATTWRPRLWPRSSTFGTVNADVLQRFDDTVTRDNFVDIIRDNPWSE